MEILQTILMVIGAITLLWLIVKYVFIWSYSSIYECYMNIYYYKTRCKQNPCSAKA
jgi:hypothetical protein